MSKYRAKVAEVVNALPQHAEFVKQYCAGECRGVELRSQVIFFLQMFVILAACRLCGWAVRRFLHQPQVIGEMIAGVILGPSLLGGLAPEVQHFLFPPESRPLLHAVAQTGIALYMFLVGLDFRSDDFKSNAKGAVAVSVSGIVVPFIVAISRHALAHERAGAVRHPASHASTPRCSSARPSPSRHSRCWRASFTIAASRGH